MRPVGAAFYFSLPHRFGWPEESLLILNWALVATSIGVGTWALAGWTASRGWLPRALLTSAVALAHVLFLWGPASNSLSDAPAAALALLSVWLLLHTFDRPSWRVHLAAGVVLGGATIIRAFYLYPAILVAGVIVGASLKQRRLPAACVFVAALLLFPGIQVRATHERTGHWSFLDPKTTAETSSLHFATALYGYDTILPGRGEPYDGTDCFRETRTFAEAFEKRDLPALACICMRRQDFYFGSYVPLNRVYLISADDRVFSPFFWLLNVGATCLAAWLVPWRQALWVAAAPLAFIGGLWLEATAIIPEARFLIVPDVVVWTLGLASLVSMVAGRMQRVRRSASASSLHSASHTKVRS